MIGTARTVNNSFIVPNGVPIKKIKSNITPAPRIPFNVLKLLHTINAKHARKIVTYKLHLLTCRAYSQSYIGVSGAAQCKYILLTCALFNKILNCSKTS